MDKTKIPYILVLFAVILMTALTACSDDIESLDSLSAGEVLLTIEATPAATRTVLSTDGTTVLWQADDEIAVYDYVASKHRFGADEVEGNQASFTGKVTSKLPNFLALYPYDLAADNLSSGRISATLPTTQYAVANGFPLYSVDGGYVSCNISVAKGERNLDGSPSVVTFHNVGQMLQFTVPDYVAGKVSSIQFSANTAVAGTLSVDYSGSTPSTTVSGSQTLTILPSVGSSTFASGTYYIVTAPVQMNGFSMTFTCEGKTYRLSSTTTFGGQAGKVYTLGAIDLVNTPSVTATHIYNTVNGVNTLQGTRVQATNAPVEGRTWSVSIKNSAGNVLRSISGTGDLTSAETDASWPYLPMGNYTVEYSYTTSNNKTITKSVPISIAHPSLTLAVDAYTAHSKYEEGNAEAANACDRLTVYSPSATLSVASSLLANSNYTTTYTHTLNGKTATSSTSTWANYTEIPVSGSLYTLSVTANFAGTTATGSKQVRITGLPADFTPPTKATGWSNDKGTTDFNSDHVRLGNASWSQPHRIKNSTWFNIPKDTRVGLDYDIVLHRAAVDVTANVKMGSQEVVTCTDTKYNNDIHNTGLNYFTLSEQVTSVTCEGSYGSGATCSKVYKLNFMYGTKTN